ncbi:MAG TPA: OmpA family protein [Bacteroidales bacterium]|nr:OmpA family protein [Bacteroidales bacterium]HQP04313.1 OmpA family protein [Bacteroidales bacterium]
MAIPVVASAQDKKLKKADEIFATGEYYRALELYQGLIRKVKDKRVKQELYFKSGECYFYINNFKKARANYKKAVKHPELGVDAYYKLGLTSKLTGDYEQAILDFKEALSIYPGDSLSQQGLESCELSVKWMQERSRFEAEKFKEANSRENDFCPTVVENNGYPHLYFSSTRKEAMGKKTSGITGEKFSDLFVVKFGKQGKWSKVNALDSINTIYDEGSATFVNDGRDLFYTSCVKEKGKKLGCQVYKARKESIEMGNNIDVQWMNPERVDILPDSISFGHPAFSPDGTIMYFSSRKDGGFGGADLWYSEQEGSTWSKPKNMGPIINTKGDELFPFMRADGVLYFSSDRHPSMGGLDIFKAYKDENKKWVVVNMKPPFNSNGNDFGLYYFAGEEKGYFTSDRKGSQKEDIYSFVKPILKIEFKGQVFDLDTKQIADSAIITLYCINGPTKSDTISLAEEGRFQFELKENSEYSFSVEKEGYFRGRGRLRTDTLDFDYTFEEMIYIENYNKTVEIPNIEFEFGKYSITEASKSSLNSLIKLMQDNANLVIELSAHTDMVGTDESNMELSIKRIESVKQYLIEKGINSERIKGVGYGESKPKQIRTYTPEHPWLQIGTVLDETYILSLDKEKQEIANQMNRRIEFRVISNKYEPGLD